MECQRDRQWQVIWIVPCGEIVSEDLVGSARQGQAIKGGEEVGANAHEAEAVVARSRRFGPVERWGETRSGSFVGEQQQYQW